MKNFSNLLSVIAVIIAVFAWINSYKAPKQSGLSAEAVSAALNENPKMVIDAFNNYQEQQRIAAEKAAKEAMEKFLPDLVSTDNALFVGPEDAKTTVVEFFDFSCGYCKRLAPELEKVVAANNDVKFIFFEYYTAVMAANGRMSEADVDVAAEKLGLDMEKFKTDLAAEDVAGKLEKISELADNVQVRGVPSLFINGKPVHAMNAEELQKLIDEAK